MISKRCWLCVKRLKNGICVNKNCPESIRAKMDKEYKEVHNETNEKTKRVER